jgi:hypothetical protein
LVEVRHECDGVLDPGSFKDALNTAQIVTIDVLKICSVMPVKRAAATLALVADAVDELTEVGELDLDKTAALGFANVVRSCSEDLQKLTPTAGGKRKGGANRQRAARA